MSLDIELLLLCTVLNVLAVFAEFSPQFGLIKAGIKDRGFDRHLSRACDVQIVIARHYGPEARRYAHLRPIRTFLHPGASPLRVMTTKRRR